MADYISREKEFRKLNDKLDNEFKRSTLDRIEQFGDKIETQIQSNSSKPKGNESQKFNMNNNRFATFTKSKGLGMNWLKKSGGGDFISPPKSPISKIRRNQNNNNLNKNINKNCTSPVTETIAYSNGPIKQRKLRETEVSGHGHDTTNLFGKTETPDGQILIKYHNHKFSSSPSLDDLIQHSIDSLEATSELDDPEQMESNTNSNKRSSKPASPNVLECKNNDGKPIKKVVNANGLMRFLKAKIALHEENQAKCLDQLSHQKEAFDELNERFKLVKQQRDKALLKCSSLSDQLDKMTNQYNSANKRSMEQSQESIDNHKELESLKRTIKQMTLTHKNLEARYERIQEELQTALKSQSSLKKNEREFKEKMRHQADAKDAEIKSLKKQRADLFTAYKKQLYLIHNLRQQNICMEQAKMIDFSEKEFCKILEWSIPS